MSRSPFFPWLFVFAFVGIALVAFRFSPKAALAAQPAAESIEFLIPAHGSPDDSRVCMVIFLADSQPNTAPQDPQEGGASVQPVYALRKMPHTNGGLAGFATKVLPTQKVPPGTRLSRIAGGELVVMESGETYRRYVGTIL
jgi:hypothetical protein